MNRNGAPSISKGIPGSKIGLKSQQIRWNSTNWARARARLGLVWLKGMDLDEPGMTNPHKFMDLDETGMTNPNKLMDLDETGMTNPNKCMDPDETGMD